MKGPVKAREMRKGGEQREGGEDISGGREAHRVTQSLFFPVLVLSSAFRLFKSFHTRLAQRERNPNTLVEIFQIWNSMHSLLELLQTQCFQT